MPKTKQKPQPPIVRRPGPGRPANSGRYGCATKPIRVPAHLIADIEQFVQKRIKAERKPK